MKINNYIENFMNDYGIEIGEVFTDKFETTFFKIVKDTNGKYCVSRRDEYEEYFNFCIDEERFFGKLLSGELEICRLPYRPYEGETFYFLESCSGHGEEFSSYRVSSAYFNSKNVVHFQMWKIGNCFKTDMEARANVDKVFGYIKDDKKNWRIYK